MQLPDNLRFVDFHPKEENIRDMVQAGLEKAQKEIPAKFLYDKRGSELLTQSRGNRNITRHERS